MCLWPSKCPCAICLWPSEHPAILKIEQVLYIEIPTCLALEQTELLKNFLRGLVSDCLLAAQFYLNEGKVIHRGDLPVWMLADDIYHTRVGCMLVELTTSESCLPLRGKVTLLG
jgi:hypothetical protein